MPGETTIQIGLKHLKDQIEKKRNFYIPKINKEYAYSNFIMLNYYRNPINFIFFNESVIVCSLFSFDLKDAWENGVPIDQLFERACFLAELIKREEVLKERITPETRDIFDGNLRTMMDQRLVTIKEDSQGVTRVVLKSSGEAQTLLIGSICWPMIDTYYVVLVFALSMAKNKNVEESKFAKDVQWLAETLFIEKKIQYFESCNQPAITNAKTAMLSEGIFKKKDVYVNLAPEYLKSDGEKRLVAVIDRVGQYRSKPTTQSLLEDFSPEEDLRRTIFSEFPMMAKL